MEDGELEVLLQTHISLSEWQGLVANLGHGLELQKKLTKTEILAITIDEISRKAKSHPF